MSKKTNLMYSIVAGMCIGIGGVAYLAVHGGVLGSILFCVGLYTILTFGFNLFTGKSGNLVSTPLWVTSHDLRRTGYRGSVNG